MDNTCRSIMAEAVMNSVNKNNLLEVESRGIVVLFSEPINQRVIPILRNFGLAPLKESSEKLCKEDFRKGTLILAMTAREKRMILDEFESDDVYTITEYVGQGGDIEEPGGDLAGYGVCYEYIDFIVKVVAEKLFRQIGGE